MITDAQLREYWLALKEDIAEATQVDGEPPENALKALEELRAEMLKRGLEL